MWNFILDDGLNVIDFIVVSIITISTLSASRFAMEIPVEVKGRFPVEFDNDLSLHAHSCVLTCTSSVGGTLDCT